MMQGWNFFVDLDGADWRAWWSWLHVELWEDLTKNEAQHMYNFLDIIILINYTFNIFRLQYWWYYNINDNKFELLKYITIF